MESSIRWLIDHRQKLENWKSNKKSKSFQSKNIMSAAKGYY